MVLTAEKYLTVADVAERLNVQKDTVRDWLLDGRLAGFRPGGPRMGWRIEQAQFDRFVEDAKRRSQPRSLERFLKDAEQGVSPETRHEG